MDTILFAVVFAEASKCDLFEGKFSAQWPKLFSRIYRDEYSDASTITAILDSILYLVTRISISFFLFVQKPQY